jgi:hypothetical protein
VISGKTLLFTLIAVFIRTPVYLLSLLNSGVDKRGRLLIAWFGPRGLSSLLLILLPVFAGVPGSDRMFAICSLVVLVSIVLHGGSPMLLARAARKRKLEEARVDAVSNQTAAARVAERSPVAESARLAAGAKAAEVVCDDCVVDGSPQVGAERISLDELQSLWKAKQPVRIVDVRTERSLEESDLQAGGAVRMPPDHVVERARELRLKPDDWLVLYCA